MDEIIIPLPSGPVPVTEIPDRSVSLEVYQAMALNTYQHNALVPKLNDEALVQITRDVILPNITRCAVPTTYDEALAVLFAPELVRRLESMQVRA